MIGKYKLLIKISKKDNYDFYFSQIIQLFETIEEALSYNRNDIILNIEYPEEYEVDDVITCEILDLNNEEIIECFELNNAIEKQENSLKDRFNSPEFEQKVLKAKTDKDVLDQVIKEIYENHYIVPIVKKLYFLADKDTIDQLALISMLKLIEYYEPNKGAKFTTFVSNYLPGYVRDKIIDDKEKKGYINTTKYFEDIKWKIKDFSSKYYQENGKYPDENTVLLSFPEDSRPSLITIKECMFGGASQSTLSLDPIRNDENEETLIDIVSSKSNDDIVDFETLSEKVIAILNDTKYFTERDKDIVLMKNGIGQYKNINITSKEIAKKYGISEARVSNLYNKAKHKLNYLRKKNFC